VSDQIEIRRLASSALDDQIDALADVLVDCVAGGASVSYMAPFSHDEARSAFEVVAAEVERGSRVARLLMEHAEAEARAEGKTLLVLDTVTGDSAERLYERLGWTKAGVIPGYALYPDRRPCDTTVFWKAL